MKLFSIVNAFYILLGLIAWIAAAQEVVTTVVPVTLIVVTGFEINATVTTGLSVLGQVLNPGSHAHTFWDTSYLLATRTITSSTSSTYVSSQTTTVTLARSSFTTSTKGLSRSTTATITSSSSGATASSINVTKTSQPQPTKIIAGVVVSAVVIILVIITYLVFQRRKRSGKSNSLRSSFGRIKRWQASVSTAAPTGISLGSMTPSLQRYNPKKGDVNSQSKDIPTTPIRPRWRPASITGSVLDFMDGVVSSPGPLIICAPENPTIQKFDPALKKTYVEACKQNRDFSGLPPLVGAYHPVETGLPVIVELADRHLAPEPLSIHKTGSPKTSESGGLIASHPYPARTFGSVNRAESRTVRDFEARKHYLTQNLGSQFNESGHESSSPAELDSNPTRYDFRDSDEENEDKRAAKRAETLMRLEGAILDSRRPSSVYSTEWKEFKEASDKKRIAREEKKYRANSAARTVARGAPGFF